MKVNKYELIRRRFIMNGTAARDDIEWLLDQAYKAKNVHYLTLCAFFVGLILGAALNG